MPTPPASAYVPKTFAGETEEGCEGMASGGQGSEKRRAEGGVTEVGAEAVQHGRRALESDAVSFARSPVPRREHCLKVR
ncbi:MAG: hypothetical protein LCH53_13220 [Bacteroidetes bacterium]|nr:hypothetical protein [Bacteroidota bacterium]